MAYSARPTSTDSLTKQIVQTAHGFGVGEVIYFDMGTLTYLPAKADSLSHTQGAMIVSIVIDANTFYATQVGYVTGISTPYGPFTPGDQYYISPTSAGLLTATPPSTFGQVLAPVFVADSTSSGFFYTGAFTMIGGSPVISSYVTVMTDTDMLPNTGYFVNSASLVHMALPASIVNGQLVEVIAVNTGGFVIVQNSGQQINFVPDQTTVGVTGNIELEESSGVLRGSLKIICYVDNDDFEVINSIGNFNVS